VESDPPHVAAKSELALLHRDREGEENGVMSDDVTGPSPGKHLPTVEICLGGRSIRP